MNFTASTVPLLLSTTFLPLWSVSAPPKVHVQRIGQGRRVAEGVAEGLAVGLALLLERRDDLAHSSQRLGVLVAPASLSHDFR